MRARPSSVGSELAPAVERPGHPAAWTMLAIPLGLAGLAMSAYLPPELLLAAFSVLLVVVGFAIAAGCWLAGLPGDRLAGPREIAAALVFLGFAGGILTDTREALSQLQQLEARGLAAFSR